jgi:hypothetical protein
MAIEQNGRLEYTEHDAELVERTNQLLQRAIVRALEDRAAEQQQRQEYRESAAYHGGWVPGGATDAQRDELRGDYQRRQEWNGLIKDAPETPYGRYTDKEIAAERGTLEKEFLSLKDASSSRAQEIADNLGAISEEEQYRNGIKEARHKAPAEMTKPEIVTEARELHAHFQQLMDRFEQAPAGPQRMELREEMKPLVTRENELRDEYTGRVKAEMSVSQFGQDRIPEISVGYGR